MAKSKVSKSHRRDRHGAFLKEVAILAVCVIIVYIWYNSNPTRADAQLAGWGFTNIDAK